LHTHLKQAPKNQSENKKKSSCKTGAFLGRNRIISI